MRNYEKEQPQPTPETITLQPGLGVYAIKETVLDLEKKSFHDDSVEEELVELSNLVQQARESIESQGGVFNGIIEREVHRTDQDYMGMTVVLNVVYAIAYKPEYSNVTS